MENWSLSKIILTVGALAVVAGASFLISSAGNKPAILDRPPEVIENIDPTEDPFKGEGPRVQGGISVVPTEIVVENAITGVDIPKITVSNNTQIERTISVSFLPVDKGLVSGGPSFAQTPESIRRGKSILKLDQDKIVLKPGESGSVGGTIIGGDDKKMTVGAINFAISGKNTIGLPEQKGVKPEVSLTLQVSSVIYMIFDKPDSKKVSLESLSSRLTDSKNPRKGLNFFAVVKSENDFLSTPKGVVTIRDFGGNRVASTPFAGDQNVFPRGKREIFTPIPLKLDPGEYQVEARVISGDSGQSIKKPLEIAEDGSPVDVQAGASIQTESIKTLPGRPFPAEVQVANSGNKDISPKGTVTLYDPVTNKLIDKQELSLEPVRPGEATTQSFSFTAPEKQGNYIISAEINDSQDKFLAESSADMIVTKTGIIKKTQFDKFRDWLSDNPLRSIAVGIIGFGLLTLILIAGVAIIKKIKTKKS